MTQSNPIIKKEIKQRLTAFVDPVIVTRAKVRGALEGLTLSEVVEKALDAYAPKIENGKDHINVKFINYPVKSTIKSEVSKNPVINLKHSKTLTVPR
jgi:hypothetical protein